MPEYEPIDYRLRCHTKRTDLPSDVLRDIGEAYEAIGRLTAERNEARVLYCNQLSPVDPHKIAEKWRWDCFKDEQEKFWDALDRVRGTPSRTQAMDRIAQLDEEMGLN